MQKSKTGNSAGLLEEQQTDLETSAALPKGVKQVAENRQTGDENQMWPLGHCEEGLRVLF
jgi:hypothetical protein